MKRGEGVEQLPFQGCSGETLPCSARLGASPGSHSAVRWEAAPLPSAVLAPGRQLPPLSGRTSTAPAGEGFPRVEFPGRLMCSRFPPDLKPQCALVVMACKCKATGRGWGLEGAAGKRK